MTVRHTACAWAFLFAAIASLPFAARAEIEYFNRPLTASDDELSASILDPDAPTGFGLDGDEPSVSAEFLLGSKVRESAVSPYFEAQVGLPGIWSKPALDVTVMGTDVLGESGFDTEVWLLAAPPFCSSGKFQCGAGAVAEFSDTTLFGGDLTAKYRFAKPEINLRLSAGPRVVDGVAGYLARFWVGYGFSFSGAQQLSLSARLSASGAEFASAPGYAWRLEGVYRRSEWRFGLNVSRPFTSPASPTLGAWVGFAI